MNCLFLFLTLSVSALSVVGLATPMAFSSDDWPQWRGPGRDGVWLENGIVSEFASEKLPAKWSAPVGSGYSGPTVANGCVYLTSYLNKAKQVEQVHCVDQATGTEIWKHVYDCEYMDIGYPLGPRAAVAISDGKAYALGTMGHLHCLDAATGEVIWKSNFENDFNAAIPVWGITASPLVDDDRVYVQVGGQPDAVVMAFDKKTGDEVWRSLDGGASYSAPKFIEQNGKQLLLVWTGDWFAALEPKSGEPVWKKKFNRAKGVINVADPVVDKATGRIFLTSFYDGSYLYKLDANKMDVDLLWKRKGRSEIHTDALHSIIMTSVILGDYVYGLDSYGAMRCLDLRNGDRVWEDQTLVDEGRWATAFFVQNRERTWMFTEKGELVIGSLSPSGFQSLSRTKLIDPTTFLPRRNDNILWSHPAYADRHIFVRNDKQLISVDLSD